MRDQHSFFYRNGLSLVLFSFFFVFVSAQAVTGWKEHNEELQEFGQRAISFHAYLTSGHFVQTTFENWESEFLQMAMYVMLTVFLRQQGSSESKSMDEPEEVDREPDPNRPGAPWPVKRGGLWLAIYKHSLSLAFFLLFLVSFMLHACGSLADYNEQQHLKGKPQVSLAAYFGETRFWYESFQNWQSEFIAVLSIVLLSVFLRQKGSPESKPVDAPHAETGE